MLFLPKIEKITRDATISHFFLMFGYKLFSLYFPLFLISRNFSLPQVGYTYLLIYLPIAVFAPFVGFLSHKINPAILASMGILGYGIYALGMILIQNSFLFYFWQILLGISAALFFVSSRAILMVSQLENPNRAFGWFYSAPFYADAIAPAVGAFFIWKFDFFGVFILSLALQIFTAIFCFLRLKNQRIKPLDHQFNLHKFQQNYGLLFQKLRKKEILSSLLVSFSTLLVAGSYFAFFVLFLKEKFFWSQNKIMILMSLVSFLFLPVSLFLIRNLARFKSSKNIFQGTIIAGIFSVLFGLFTSSLNFFITLSIKIGQISGNLISNSGRSGLISQVCKDNPEEAGALDTIFSPLGTAFGALISGLVIGFLGYQYLFILGGVFVLIAGFLSKRFAKI